MSHHPAAHSSPGKTSGSRQPKSKRGPASDQPQTGPSSPSQRVCSTSNKSTVSTASAILKSVSATADCRGIVLSTGALSHELSLEDGTFGIGSRAISSLSEATTFALALSARLSMDRATSPLVSDTFRSHALGLLASYQKFLVDWQTSGLVPSLSEEPPKTTAAPSSE